MTREELGAFLQRERMRGKLFEIKLRGLELEQRFMETASPEEWRAYVLYKKELEKRYNHNHDSKGRFASSNSKLTIAARSDIIKSKDTRLTIASINSPIEQTHTGKGNPNAIRTHGAQLNNRQKELLEKLPNYDSRVIVSRDDVNMSDLAALTAYTGHEFAMFTNGSKRLIVRGDERRCEIDYDDAVDLARQGYKWSGHTHQGDTFLSMTPSDGDYLVLTAFEQNSSAIYNSKGDFRIFDNRR